VGQVHTGAERVGVGGDDVTALLDQGADHGDARGAARTGDENRGHDDGCAATDDAATDASSPDASSPDASSPDA
jgi:hypothetical protein